MNQNSNVFRIKTKIPEHLKSLPIIKFNTKRKYRIDFYTPKSLVELSCLTIEVWKVTTDKKGASCSPLDKILSNSPKIDSDSCYHLCNINEPVKALLYLKEKAATLDLSIFNLLRTMRIVMDETTERRQYWELKNHWGKIPAGRPRYPCVLFGELKKL